MGLNWGGAQFQFFPWNIRPIFYRGFLRHYQGYNIVPRVLRVQYCLKTRPNYGQVAWTSRTPSDKKSSSLAFRKGLITLTQIAVNFWIFFFSLFLDLFCGNKKWHSFPLITTERSEQIPCQWSYKLAALTRMKKLWNLEKKFESLRYFHTFLMHNIVGVSDRRWHDFLSM